MNPEYHLVRLTAQSKRSDPKQPQGGMPEFSNQDVQLLCALIGAPTPEGFNTNLPAYWAVTAKYCQSDISEVNLVNWLQRISWAAWYGNRRNSDTPLMPSVNDRLAESAVLLFLNPRDREGKLRSLDWVASYVGKGRATFFRRYRAHWGRLLAKLHELETRGLGDVQFALRRSSDAA